MDRVFSPLTRLSAGPSAHTAEKTPAEKVRENIVGTKPAMLVHPLLQTLQSVSIVNLPLFRVGKNFVGKRNLLELLARFRVLVWVELFG